MPTSPSRKHLYIAGCLVLSLALTAIGGTLVLVLNAMQPMQRGN